MSESHGNTKLLDWDALVIGERLPTLSYVLTQEMIDEFRKGVQDPEAAYPTISQKVDVRPYHLEECVPYIEGWHRLAADAGIVLHIETHRDRMTTDLDRKSTRLNSSH